MILFTLGVKNLPPEAVTWYASSGFMAPGTRSLKPIGEPIIARNERFTFQWNEADALYPTFIYVEAYDDMGNILRPPVVSDRLYWQVKSGSYIYDWETSEVLPSRSILPIIGILAATGLIFIVARKR